MRGRPRKSVEQLKLEGSFREDRHGGNGLDPNGEPVKPAHLHGAAAEMWDTVTPELVRLGIATAVDSAALTSLCEWWQEYRDAADERTRDEVGLSQLASAVNGLASVLLVTDSGDAVDAAERVISEIGLAIETHVKNRRSRVTRMKAAYTEFTKIAARFGLTPMDRRAMRDVDSGSTKEDPLMEYLKKRNALAS